MYAKIFLIEDEDVIAKFYIKRLTDSGFKDIEYFPSTEDVEQKIINGYTKPSIILSDYFIKPQTPLIFVPKLRAAGMEAPLVIASGEVGGDSMNDFLRQGWLNGYYSKTESLPIMMTRVCQHLIDLNDLAQTRYDEWTLLRQYADFADSYTRAEVQIMQRLLLQEDLRQIQTDSDLSERKIYKLREAMLSEIYKSPSRPRDAVIFEKAIARRIGL